MKLHELKVGESGAGPVSNGHAVPRGNIRISGLTVHITESAGRQQNSAGMNVVNVSGRFFEESKTGDAPVFKEQLGGKRKRADLNGLSSLSARQKSPANFTPCGVTVRVEDAGAAMRCFAGECQLRSRAVKLCAPLDQFLDVTGAFFDESLDSLRATKAIASLDG